MKEQDRADQLFIRLTKLNEQQQLMIFSSFYGWARSSFKNRDLNYLESRLKVWEEINGKQL